MRCAFNAGLFAAAALSASALAAATGTLIHSPGDILAYAKSLDKELADIHRDFHRYPELGFEEFRTTAKIKEHLAKIPGVEIKKIPLKTGVVAEIRGTRPELGTIGMRCDIDALPITEETTHGYASLTKGKMHACGHDGHMTIVLGAVKILSKFRPRHNVRFIFQPAEEVMPSGAPEMIKAGAADGLKMIWGFHLNATSDLGNVGWCDGIVMAGGYTLDIAVEGRSVHTAYPDRSVNPIVVLSRIAVAVDSLKQMVRATRPYSVTLLHLESPSVAMVASPARGRLVLKTRYHEPEVNAFLVKKIREIVGMYCGLYGATYEIKEEQGLEPTYNYESMGPLVRENAAAFGFPLEHIFASMGGDDFGCYGWKVPAYYMTFGIREGDGFHLAHTPKFAWNESILAPAAAMMASCALRREYPDLKTVVPGDGK